MKASELKDLILKSNDIRKEKVHVKEWGCDVWIRQLTAKEQDDFEKEVRSAESQWDVLCNRAKLISRCLVDEEGNKVFETEEDVVKLSTKCGDVINRLMEKTQKLNTISDADLKEMAKNS